MAKQQQTTCLFCLLYKIDTVFFATTMQSTTSLQISAEDRRGASAQQSIHFPLFFYTLRSSDESFPPISTSRPRTMITSGTTSQRQLISPQGNLLHFPLIDSENPLSTTPTEKECLEEIWRGRLLFNGDWDQRDTDQSCVSSVVA